jgi:hypothetical protein
MSEDENALECAICEEPCDGGCKNEHGEPVHSECLDFVRGYTDSPRLYRCPYCGLNTPHPRGPWDKLLMSRVACAKCGCEFFIVDDVPMTEKQYAERKAKADS